MTSEETIELTDKIRKNKNLFQRYHKGQKSIALSDIMFLPKEAWCIWWRSISP